MMARNFKIVYLPENNSNIKEFNLSRVKLFFLALISFCIIISITVYTVNVLTDGLYNFRLKKIQQERMVLGNRLHNLENKVSDLKNDIEVVIKRDDEIRIFADLPQFDDDVRALGVGGSVTRKPILSSFYSDETDISYDILEDLKKLERQIDFAKESYHEVFVKLEQNIEMVRYWPSIRPVEGGRLTDRYGPRIHPITKRREIHTALDISVPKGTPIMAAADGVIDYCGKNRSSGNYVRIDHKSNEFGYKTAYAHLNKIYVKRKQKVKRGDIIGEVGRTGMSTASHLHYEVWYHGKAVDPMNYYADPSVLR